MMICVVFSFFTCRHITYSIQVQCTVLRVSHSSNKPRGQLEKASISPRVFGELRLRVAAFV